jgi:hypothetical protein
MLGSTVFCVGVLKISMGRKVGKVTVQSRQNFQQKQTEKIIGPV